MELCTNGALREALKLNISWPLKVNIVAVAEMVMVAVLVAV